MVIKTHVHLDIEPHWRSHMTLLYYFAVCLPLGLITFGYCSTLLDLGLCYVMNCSILTSIVLTPTPSTL